MAIENFIPTIWSARILKNLKTNSVGAAITNRDYEGDARVGDAVNITNFIDPSIFDYTGADMTPEDIDDEMQTLLIDQKKAFNFYLDDVDAAQSVDGGRVMTEAIDRASYGLSNTLDKFLLQRIADGAANAGSGGSVSASTIYEHIVEWGVLLDEADVPSEGRWAVVPPATYGLLLTDSRFIAAGDARGAATRANGFVGDVAGFRIYKSNNLPLSGDGHAHIAGSTRATTMAEQIRKLEAYRVERKFADGVKGLHVYGAKVVRPTFLCADYLGVSGGE